ncbi:hypothetical protein ACL02P_05365 [Paenibacillus sp. MB22_1]|uniref:hypothetical protein n=1 Tax=Paenibacillus sp. MB22_1 TaxID=3383121 RepID=UPI0039A06C40
MNLTWTWADVEALQQHVEQHDGIALKLNWDTMVHPNYRRQGIFTSLLRRGLNLATVGSYPKILLNAPGNSDSAKHFLATYPCRYEFSEFQMKHSPKAACANAPSRTTQITLRSAEDAERPLLARLDQEGFDLHPEETRLYYEKLTEEEVRQNELIVHEGARHR